MSKLYSKEMLKTLQELEALIKSNENNKTDAKLYEKALFAKYRLHSIEKSIIANFLFQKDSIEEFFECANLLKCSKEKTEKLYFSIVENDVFPGTPEERKMLKEG